MNRVFIVGAARTPVGKFLGGLSSKGNVELATIAVKEAVKRAGVSFEQIENVVGGSIYKGGLKGNPARQVQIACNIPVSASASTVDQQCASAMRAFEIATMEIQLGKNDIAVAYGAESMSNAPNVILNSRTGSRIGPLKIVDSLLYDGLQCAIMNYHMGVTAENVAKEYNVSRKQQDELAYMSHQRAVAAQNAGLFDEEIIPVEIVKKGKSTFVSKDEGPKPETTLEILSKLKPAFIEDGTVTAGNASSMNDGAAALVLISEKKLKELGLTPLVEVKSIVSCGVEPRLMGIGPMFAIPKALKAEGLKKEDIGVFEVNEAFAAQCVAVLRELDLPMDITNPLGSGISLGHPVGCTGIRLLVTMIHHMKRNEIRYGLSSLCVGGGPSMATILENC